MKIDGLLRWQIGMSGTCVQARFNQVRVLANYPGNAGKRLFRVVVFVLSQAIQRLPGFGMLSGLVRATVPGVWLRVRGYAALYQRLANPERCPQFHQLYPGSSTDERINSLMLGLQKTLRGLGFESEIFVAKRDPRPGPKVLEVGDLPSHIDYALIVHEPPGRDGSDLIAGFPGKKILMPGNVTPVNAWGDQLASGSGATAEPNPELPRTGGAANSVDRAVGQDPASAPRMRIAWVSTWEVRCGIAEHSKALLEPLIDGPRGAIAELAILCDERTPPASPRAWVSIRPCWNGTAPVADRLCREISAIDADIVVIQHQPGLIKWRELVEVLEDPRVRRRKIVVALHAARRLFDLEADEQAATVESLRKVAMVLVHSSADVELLKRHDVVSNVALFPLGAEDRYCVPVVTPLTPADRAVIGCYGFFLPGKGIDRLIRAFADLRKTWPRLSLQLTNAEYSELSHPEIARCRDLASTLGVVDAIAWDTTFHTHEESMLKLALCDLVVLPYDDSKESASAALHSAMASSVPIAVTPASIFDDAGEAVFRFSRNDAPSIANGIDVLLRDSELRRQIQARASQWLAERNWAGLSRRLQGMLLTLPARQDAIAPAGSE